MEEEEDFKDLVATPQSWYYTLCMVLMDVYSIYSFIKRKSYLRGFLRGCAGAFVSLFVLFWHTLPVVNNRITELQDPRAAGGERDAVQYSGGSSHRFWKGRGREAEVVMVMRRMDTRLFVHEEEKFLVVAKGWHCHYYCC